MAQYIYGKNVIMHKLTTSQKIKKLYLFKNGSFDEIVKLANLNNIPLEYCTKQQLNQIESGKHQGIIALVEDYQFYSVDDIINSVPKDKIPLIVMLDGLEDPHNLGAILRTCDAVGVDGVIIGKHRSVSLNATVAKVSTGAIETIKVAQVTNLTKTIQELKKRNFWICGTDCDQSADYRTIDYKIPLVVVIGSESVGISRLVKENSDFLVHIPILGSVQSLNASVATGIILYQIHSQRFPL